MKSVAKHFGTDALQENSLHPNMEIDEKTPRFRTEVEQTRTVRNFILFFVVHTAGIVGGWLLFSGYLRWQCIVFHLIIGYLGGIGVTAGSHRLWAHQCYKAKAPLKYLLLFLQTLAVQDTVLIWTRDHRVHHKFTETDADPYNAKRGFYFSHIGWIFEKKHDAVMEKLKTIDMSDLESDPALVFQHKYYYPLAYAITYGLPILIPHLVWGEPVLYCFLNSSFRLMCSMHSTFLVNSAAHMWGFKPYDKSIGPVENRVVSLFAMGEGWHNYHHVFPWDYKAAELGNYRLNLTTAFIDFFAWIGWAYDLKVVSKSMVEKRAGRTGDGSWQLLNPHHEHGDHIHNHEHHHPENSPWGWGDNDISQECKDVTQTLCLGKDD